MQQNTKRMNDELQVILLDYLEACRRKPLPRLDEWIKKYPQYSEDLVQFAVCHHVVEQTTLTEKEEEALANTTFDIEQSMLGHAFANLPEPSPLASIVVRAKELKLSPELLAASLNLAVDIIMKLERRALIPDSIPSVLLERMSTVLYCGIGQLRTFLGGPAAQVSPAFYHAKQPPVRGGQQTFLEAVHKSRMMNPEQKEMWLNQIAREEDPCR